MHHYLLIENDVAIRNVIHIDDFFDDYKIHYPERIYSKFEMVFCDFIYSMILDSHLIKSEYTSKSVKKIEKEFELLNAATLTYEKETQEISKVVIKNREYATDDYYENCRNLAKDILFYLKNKKIDADYLIKQLKESETDLEFERNIKDKYLYSYYKFAKYLDYKFSNVEVIVSKTDIHEFLEKKGIRFIEF